MSYRLRWLVITLLGILLSVLLASCGGQRSTDGTVSLPLTAGLSEIQGTVEIKQPDQTQFETATDGMTLQVNGTVRTGEDGRRKT